MTNKEKYELVKIATKELKKAFKGIGAHSYGFCCGSDYDAHHNHINTNDYVDAKLYKGGLNNDFVNGVPQIGDILYYSWGLTNFSLDNVLKVLNNVYGEDRVIAPKDVTECIKIVFDI